MTGKAETFEFQTEARQLLDLMIHSVYSHPEIFLRELISNASDAIDKLKFESLTHPEWTGLAAEHEIRIEADKEHRVLTVSDTGIGMSRDELVTYLGTIAKSGTGEFVKQMKTAAAGGTASPDLIGQFGVGFYSCFMVADRVTVATRRAGSDEALVWSSSGDGTYTIEEGRREGHGTTVTLHLKEGVETSDGGENTPFDATAEWTIREIVRKYSDFVAYPIRMKVIRRKREKEGEPETITAEDLTLNSMKAIWTRPESEVTDEEYGEFYRHISHDWNAPLRRIVYRVEGTSEFRALLFVPEKAPMDLFRREKREGIHLYVKRVFIMNDCHDLVPEWLRFLRGVVDSEDLSLNISREILQQTREIATIRKSLTRKVLDHFKHLKDEDRSTYDTFWGEFGVVLKEGLFRDTGHQEALLGLSLFRSARPSGEAGDCDTTAWVSLADYVGRMKEGQEAIYYVTAPTPAAAAGSPHLEGFRAQGYEVLLLSDPVDEVWTQGEVAFEGKPLRSVLKSDITPAEKDDEGTRETEEAFRAVAGEIERLLADRVKQVRVSRRLTDSPACLVGESGDMTPQMEQILRAMGQTVEPQKRILEINPTHPVAMRLKELQASGSDAPLVEDLAELLYGQAVLAEGGTLSDPASFSKRLADYLGRG